MNNILETVYVGDYSGIRITITITANDMAIRADGIQPHPMIPDGMGLTFKKGENFLEIHYPVQYDAQKMWERLERMYKFLVMSFGTGKVEHEFSDIFPEASIQSIQ